jgi:hypothetical protein
MEGGAIYVRSPCSISMSFTTVYNCACYLFDSLSGVICILVKTVFTMNHICLNRCFAVFGLFVYLHRQNDSTFHADVFSVIKNIRPFLGGVSRSEFRALNMPVFWHSNRDGRRLHRFRW